MYDLDKIYDDVSFNSLRSLNVTCAQEKCGLLHCCMFNLFPLGSSDGLWPKFSCERLIEELKRYPSVYFAKKVGAQMCICVVLIVIILFCVRIR